MSDTNNEPNNQAINSNLPINNSDTASTNIGPNPYNKIAKNKQNFKLNLLLLSLQAISAGIFFLVVIYQLIASSSKWLSSIDNALGLGGELCYIGNSFDIPTFEIFSKIFLLIFIQFFILAGLFYIGGKLFGKKEGSFNSVISLTSTASIISTASFILSSIIITFFPYIIIFIFIFSFTCSLLLNIKSIDKIFEFGENKAVFITSGVYIIYFFILSMFIVESLKIT